MAQKYYPPISDLVTEQFPVTNLPLVSNLTNTLLDGLTYTDLFVNVSADKATRFFALKVVAKRMEAEIPGTSLKFVLFDGADEKSYIPLTLKTYWELRKYVEGFKADGFDYTPRAFFDLLLALIDVSEEDFIGGILFTFIDDADPYVKLIDEFIDTIKRYKTNKVEMDDEVGGVWNNWDTLIDELGKIKINVKDLKNTNTQPFKDEIDCIIKRWNAIASSLDLDFDIYKLAFETITKDVKNIEEKFEKLLELFRYWLGDINMNDVEDLLVPQFELTVPNVPVALEFPRSIFIPIDKASPANTPVALPDPAKTQITFNLDSLYYSTRTGFEMADKGSFSFDKSFILGTKFTLEVKN